MVNVLLKFSALNVHQPLISSLNKYPDLVDVMMHVFNCSPAPRDRLYCGMSGFGTHLTGAMGDEEMTDTSNVKSESGWQ